MEKVKSKQAIPANAILYFNDDACSLCYTEKDVMSSFEGKSVPILKINAAENPDLVKEYGILSAPSAVFIKNGRKVDQFNKYLDAKQLQIAVNYYFGGLKND